MQSPMTFDICRALTQLARELLVAGEQHAGTHVLAQGRVYRVDVSLEPVSVDQLQDVINRYR